MSFTGKATFSAAADLPEIMEDVSDVIGIVSYHDLVLQGMLAQIKAADQAENP